MLRQLLRFRCSCHGLPKDIGSRHPRVPRLERLCELCHSALGDELHLVFDCPRLADIRAQFPQLFHGVTTMQQFMWQQPLSQVAYFVDKCLRRMLRRG